MKQLTKQLKQELINFDSIEERLSFLKNKYKDETAYIVTCGPSLAKHDVDELNERLKDKLVFSVKQGYDVAKDVTDFHLLNTYNFSPYTWKDDTIVYWSLSKSYATEQLNRIIEMSAPIDLYIPVINPPFLNATQTTQATCNWDDFYMMETHTEVKHGIGMMYEMAIPLALLLGCKKIVVIGWDLGDPETSDVNNWKHSYTHNVNKVTGPEPGEMKEIIKSTESLYDWFQEKNIDLKIISDESYVSNKFKRMQLSDISSEKQKEKQLLPKHPNTSKYPSRLFDSIKVGDWDDYFFKVIQNVNNVDGCFVEMGFGQGDSVGIIKKFMEDDSIDIKNRDIWVYDSFEGFPEPTKEDYSRRNVKKGERTHPESIAYNMGIPKNRVIKGWFENTLIDNIPDESIAVLHLDCDLYESYKTCLNILYDKVAEGGLIMFDEYMSNTQATNFPGAVQAIDEFFSDKKVNIQVAQFDNEKVQKFYMYKEKNES